jgi:hypothetical protein
MLVVELVLLERSVSPAFAGIRASPRIDDFVAFAKPLISNFPPQQAGIVAAFLHASLQVGEVGAKLPFARGAWVARSGKAPAYTYLRTVVGLRCNCSTMVAILLPCW